MDSESVIETVADAIMSIALVKGKPLSPERHAEQARALNLRVMPL